MAGSSKGDKTAQDKSAAPVVETGCNPVDVAGLVTAVDALSKTVEAQVERMNELEQMVARPADTSLPEDPEDGISAAAAAELVECLAEEVLDHRDYGDKVVVVTTDGRRLEARR